LTKKLKEDKNKLVEIVSLKKIFVILTLPLLFNLAYASEEKTDDRLLEETVALSKEVKEFGKTLGIDRSPALTKSVLNAVPLSSITIYIQSVYFISKPSVAWIYFTKPCAALGIKSMSGYTKEYSVYFRCVDEYADSSAIITPDFAKSSLERRVEVFLHEDLHTNTEQLYGGDYSESLVTPLAMIAALEYFKNKGDETAKNKIADYIKGWRVISLELNSLVKEINELYSAEPHDDLLSQKAQNILANKYPNFYRRLAQILKNQYFATGFNAAISGEFMYYKDFDRVISLYEKAGNAKALIEDIKNAPAGKEDLEKYLEELDQKYSKPAQ